MKALNKTAIKIMIKLTDGLTSENSHKKIDNTDGVFMPVVVEWIGNIENTGSGDIYSVAHYGEQNGDLMRDPEMTFWEGNDLDGNRAFYPISYRNDYMGTDQESALFSDGKLTGYRVRMQADQTSFANTWMKNIRHQQGL